MNDDPPPPERRLRRGREIRALMTVMGLVTATGCSEDARVSEGQALYAANCEVCHGEEGRGNGPMAATLPVPPVSLIEHVGHHSRAELVRLITGGIPPAMPPHTLSEEQITLIVDHVWTLVPEDQVAALREMQRQVEEMAAAAAGSTADQPIDP